MFKLDTFLKFKDQTFLTKLKINHFLYEQKLLNKKIFGFGAAAKGNTLLNFLGIKKDIVSGVFENAKTKQGKLLPGSGIPIIPPIKINKLKPDIIIIIPWNISEEIVAELRSLGYEGDVFVLLPEVKRIN